MSLSKSPGSTPPGLVATDLMSLKPEFMSYGTEVPGRGQVVVLPRIWPKAAIDFSARFAKIL